MRGYGREGFVLEGLCPTLVGQSGATPCHWRGDSNPCLYMVLYIIV